jgi:hypothetical protein
MKKILIVACALALAPLASAQMYKYVDKNGKTVYTDQPPPDADPKAMHVPSSSGGNPTAPKTAVQQDKELQKGRDKTVEASKKADETATRAKAEEERCNSAKAAYAQYQLGGRITKLNDKGEKIFLGDDEIDAAREKSRQQVEQYCKS